MFKWRLHRPWRQGRMPIELIAEHALNTTGAKLDPEWDHAHFPPDLPELYYPLMTGHIGHPMTFPESFAHDDDEQKALHRIMIILYHYNPDVEYCPLLVHIMALLLKCTDAARGYAIGQAMINKSRKRSPDTIWEYFPITVRGFVKAVHALKQLCDYKGSEEDLYPFLSGETLSYFPLPIQFQFLAIFLAEGYKIIFRIAIATMIECKFVKSNQLSQSVLQHFAANVSLKKFLKKMFRVRLSRSQIAFLIDHFSAEPGKRHAIDRQHQGIHWPDIKHNQKVSHIAPIQLWLNVWAYVLPARLTHTALDIVFCSANDGVSFSTMIRKVQESPGPCSIVIQDENDNILGICLPSGLRPGITSNPEAILFAHVGKFNHLLLSQINGSIDDTLICMFEKSLNFVFGKERILYVTSDMLSGVANPVFYGHAFSSSAESISISVKHLEVIAHR